jgi:hypothetical protein
VASHYALKCLGICVIANYDGVFLEISDLALKEFSYGLRVRLLGAAVYFRRITEFPKDLSRSLRVGFAVEEGHELGGIVISIHLI